MKKIKLFLCVALFGAMSFGAYSAYDFITMSANEKAILENIEAMTSGETPGGAEGKWLWEEEWADCEFGGSITIHTSSAGFTAGTYVYSVSLISSLKSANVRYSYIPPQAGRKSYCPSGWSPCSAKECR